MAWVDSIRLSLTEGRSTVAARASFEILCANVYSSVSRKMRHQIHVWVYESDYEWLRSEAQAYDETMSATIRRLFNDARARQKSAGNKLRVVRSTPSMHRK